MKKRLCMICLLLALACVFTACADGLSGHKHEYGEWTTVKEPTCGKDGEEERECDCGEVETQEIPATKNHTFGEWIADVTQNKETRICAACGAKERRNIENLVLVDSAEFDQNTAYRYVYSDGFGITPGAYATVNNPNLDEEYEVAAAREICQKVAELSGVNQRKLLELMGTDKTVTQYEVLIGRVDREETRRVLATLAVDEYAIAAVGEKVVITSWSEAGMQAAVKQYKKILSEELVEQDGAKKIILQSGFSFVGSMDEKEWVTDFPRPDGEGMSLYKAQSGSDDSLQLLYTGDGVTQDAYRTYCKQLEGAGYVLYGSNGTKMANEIENSLFRTYVNDVEGRMIYVAYNAYAHKDEYDDYDWTIIKKIDEKALGEGAAYDYDPCIRIVSSTIENAYLPETKLLSTQAYAKVTESMITTMPIYNKAVGACYIITLEDGSFIVFDGGGVNDNGIEHDLIWNTLSALHRQIYAEEPSTSNPIHISAWVLTHAHWDHYTAFSNMLKKYGQSGKLRMDYMIANMPEEDSCYCWSETPVAMSRSKIQQLQYAVHDGDGFDFIKVHTGQKLYLANAEIEVLTTWEDLNPLTPGNDNNTCTVLRFTLFNRDGTMPVSMLWTGDANRWQSRFMCAMYGDYLKSDMVSIAHHGNAGCEIEFYDKVSPTVVWWPHNANSAQDYISANKNMGYRYEVDQHVYNDIPSVQYIFTSGGMKSMNSATTPEDGPYTTLVITRDGPRYDAIFDVVHGMRLSYFEYTPDQIQACVKK